MPKQSIEAKELYLGQGCGLARDHKKGDLLVAPAYYLGEEPSLGDWTWYDTDYYVVIQYMDDDGTFGIVAKCRDEQIANSILEAAKTRVANLEVPTIPEGYF